MKTTDFFSPKRFGLLVKHDLLLNGNSYLLKWAAWALFMLVFLLIQMYGNTSSFMTNWYNGVAFAPHGYQEQFLFFMLVLGLMIGTSFTGLGNKVKRTSFLQLPASTLEKYLLPFLLRIVVCTVLFFIIFWVDARLARELYIWMPKTQQVMINGVSLMPDVFNYSLLYIRGLKNPEAWLPLVFMFVDMAFFLFAVPLMFRKQGVVKTVLTFFSILFVVFMLFVLFSHLFYPETQGFNVLLREYPAYKNYSNMELFISIVSILTWPFLFVLGYYKLKEMKL